MQVAKLAGETVREIGALVFVFAPLESTFADRSLSPIVLTLVVCGSVIAILCGILLETKYEVH